MKEERDSSDGSSKHYEGWEIIIYEIRDFNLPKQRQAG